MVQTVDLVDTQSGGNRFRKKIRSHSIEQETRTRCHVDVHHIIYIANICTYMNMHMLFLFHKIQ